MTFDEQLSSNQTAVVTRTPHTAPEVLALIEQALATGRVLTHITDSFMVFWDRLNPDGPTRTLPPW